MVEIDSLFSTWNVHINVRDQVFSFNKNIQVRTIDLHWILFHNHLIWVGLGLDIFGFGYLVNFDSTALIQLTYEMAVSRCMGLYNHTV